VNNMRVIVFGICSLIFSQMIYADCYLSKENKVGVGFFNGVNTTQAAAQASVVRLNSLTKHKAKLYYNHTQGLMLDLLETYQQRIAESYPAMAVRYDLMDDILSANGQVSRKLMDSGDAGISAAIQSFRDAAVGLERSAMSRIATMTKTDYGVQSAQLRRMVIENGNVVLIAHSQGNLFANHAYEALGAAEQSKITVMHVAPASVRVYGKYLLSDLDLVIKPLASADGRSPSDVLSWFDARESRSADWTGHGFNEVYLNSDLPFVQQVVAAVDGDGKAATTGNEGLYGAYRWNGSINYHSVEGSAWMKTSFSGKTGTWVTNNGCSGDVALDPSGEGAWHASFRTKKGDCLEHVSAELVADDKDGKQVALYAFGANKWIVGAMKPYLAGFGIKGDNLLVCIK